MSEATVCVGNAAGFAGDRCDASLAVIDALAQRPGQSYLTFEVLAERTLALAQRQRLVDAALGFSPFLDTYMGIALAPAMQAGVKIVSNMGAANPVAAASRILAIASERGLAPPKVAAITGDDLLSTLGEQAIRDAPIMEGIAIDAREIVAANAYLGARPIATALAMGADIVITGRTTDPALILGPLIHELSIDETDWDRLAAGTLAGHLLECGAQVTGGYFADPGFKDVPDLANVGFPIVEFASTGDFTVTKPEDTGGVVNAMTVKEQMLYEIHDPANYTTADVVLDITAVRVEETGRNRVHVSGARGKPRPSTLKVTVSMDGGYLGESEVSYAGPNALARARLAADVIRRRCEHLGIREPLRVDVIGCYATFDNVHGEFAQRADIESDGDFRVRAACRSQDKQIAEQVVNEVLSLLCSGPAAGGGWRQSITPRVDTASILVDRERIAPRVVWVTK